MRKLLAIFLGLASASVWGAGPVAVDLELQEWQVPWPRSRPRDPAVGEDGRIWFVGQGDDYLGVMTPPDEQGKVDFRRYDLPEGTGPHNVVAGPDGRLWVAGNRNARIIRVSPGTGRQKSYKLKRKGADPHTQMFGPAGYLWFTLQHYNAIGRLEPKTGDIHLVRLPTENARPYGLGIADNGDVWFTEFGTNKIARLDPGQFKVKEYRLPREEARPRRLVVTETDEIWYVDYAGGYLGHLNPKTGEFREWPVPAGNDAMPYGMALDDRGRAWFVQTGPSPNTLIGFDPETETFIAEVAIPSGGGAVRHMVYDPASRSLWFGTDANTIVRAEVGSWRVVR